MVRSVQRRPGEDYRSWEARNAAERDKLLECGCAPAGSHGRTRCEEAKRLDREVKRLLDLEAAMRAEYGPAAPETREISSDRRLASDLYRVHVGHGAMYRETEELLAKGEA